MRRRQSVYFFFKDTAPPELSSLSLPAALPIFGDFAAHGLRVELLADLDAPAEASLPPPVGFDAGEVLPHERGSLVCRSEEHTSELQSRQYLVCRLLLEKKKNTPYTAVTSTPSF